MESYDLIIIGSGSAGVSAAITADSLGARTLLIEKGPIGGTCLNIGCVPTKSLLRLGEVVHLAKQENLKSVKGNQYVSLNFPQALEEARRTVRTLSRVQFREPLSKLVNALNMTGTARFVGPHHIEVDGHMIAGDKFLIATGSKIYEPRIDGLAEVGYLTSSGILELTRPPVSLIVLGGGPLGLEFAQMFRHFGTKVRVIHRGRRILPRAEPEIAEAAQAWLEADGVEITVGASPKVARAADGRKIIVAASNGIEVSYRAEEIMLAAGRCPNTGGLGLDNLGMEIDSAGAIVVDDEMRTSVSNIFAAGDVRGEPMLESVAAKEGEIAALNALSRARLQMDYDSIPNCVFTHPEVAQVGLTEAEAAGRGHRVETRTLDFSKVPKAQMAQDPRGVIKMVVEQGTRRVLGCGLVADHAGELIHEPALAVKYRLTVDDLGDLAHAYPTLSEATGMVARMFKRDIALLQGTIGPEERAA